MCRTFEESISTFVITFSIGCILIASKKQQHITNGIILLSFCFMQLSDAIIHYSILTNNDILNKIFTKYITHIILYLEAPITYYAVYKLTKKRIPLFEITYFIIGSLYLIKIIYDCNEKSIVPINNTYLQWCQSNMSSYRKITFLIGLLFAAWQYPNDIYKFSIYSTVITAFAINFFDKSFGSKWCHYANYLSIFLLIFYIFNV